MRPHNLSPEKPFVPILPIHFKREELPLYKDRPGLDDAAVLTNWDAQCNGGILYLLLNCGLSKHAAAFVEEWLKLPPCTTMAARAMAIVEAFRRSESEFIERGPKTTELTLAQGLHFRSRMVSYFFNPDLLKFCLSHSEAESEEWAVRNAHAMSSFMEPLLRQIPHDMPTSFISSEEVIDLALFCSAESLDSLGTEKIESLLQRLRDKREKR
jgi:hypothetical protein